MRNGLGTKCCLCEHPGRGTMANNGFPQWYPIPVQFLVLSLLGPQVGRAPCSRGLSRGGQLRTCFYFLSCLVRPHIEIIAFRMCGDPCLGFVLMSLGAKGSPENGQNHASALPVTVLTMCWYSLVLIAIIAQEASSLIFLIMQLKTRWPN